MTISVENIYERFRDWLVIQSNLTWSDMSNWTSGIRQFFYDFAQANGCEAIYTDRQRRMREYLVDIVLRHQGTYNKIILGIESELSGRRNEILYDFRKVIDIKSKYHLGFFRLNSDIRADLLESMKKIVQLQDSPIVHERIFVIFVYYKRDEERLYISCHEISFDGDHVQWEKEENYDFNYA